MDFIQLNIRSRYLSESVLYRESLNQKPLQKGRHAETYCPGAVRGCYIRCMSCITHLYEER
jgi:hypothetical protein